MLVWTFPPRAALDDPARRDSNPQLNAAASTGHGGQRRAPARSSGTRRDSERQQRRQASDSRPDTRRQAILRGTGSREKDDLLAHTRFLFTLAMPLASRLAGSTRVIRSLFVIRPGGVASILTVRPP